MKRVAEPWRLLRGEEDPSLVSEDLYAVAVACRWRGEKYNPVIV